LIHLAENVHAYAGREVVPVVAIQFRYLVEKGLWNFKHFIVAVWLAKGHCVLEVLQKVLRAAGITTNLSDFQQFGSE
jgi:hypothetical protein